MKHLARAKTQQAKRYLVNKMPQMSQQELLIIQSMIDNQLKSFSSHKADDATTVSTHHNDWEVLKQRMQPKVRYQLLYNAIQSRLISDAHVSE